MAEKYKDDPDLEFFRFCGEEDLATLTRFLTHDTDGKERLTSGLRQKPEFKEKKDAPGWRRANWQLIATELQLFGGDTFANTIRGTGVSYREIVTDICSKLRIRVDRDTPIAEMEAAVLGHLLSGSWANMSNHDRSTLVSKAMEKADGKGLPEMVTALLNGGPAASRIARIVAGSLAAATLSGAEFAAARGLAMFAGPFGVALTAAMTALPAISGPAFRVTIPAVVQVAYMRLAQTAKEHF